MQISNTTRLKLLRQKGVLYKLVAKMHHLLILECIKEVKLTRGFKNVLK